MTKIKEYLPKRNYPIIDELSHANSRLSIRQSINLMLVHATYTISLFLYIGAILSNGIRSGGIQLHIFLVIQQFLFHFSF